MKRRNFITGLIVTLIFGRQVAAATTSGITVRDWLVLVRQDGETLAEWSCILNGWSWPRLLPDPEPPTYIPNGRRGQIRDWIDNRIGRKAVSWKHNQSVMSREEFELWWNSWHGGKKSDYEQRYPFRSEDFHANRRKRWQHSTAMYARHGAVRMRYIER